MYQTVILRDAILAWVHFILIFALVGTLVAELALYRKSLDIATLRRLARIDSMYGALAGLVVVSGILRVIYSPKGASYFMHNPIFWTKMGLFVAVALLSIPPTLHYIQIVRSHANDAIVTLADRQYNFILRFMYAEAALLVFIPLCATLMARGYR